MAARLYMGELSSEDEAVDESEAGLRLCRDLAAASVLKAAAA